MIKSSGVTSIDTYPERPEMLLKSLLNRLENKLITINLATLDSEFGVLNRTLIYRQLMNDAVVFITERNSRKYENIVSNPKVSLTILFPEIQSSTGTEVWEVRLVDAIATELDSKSVSQLWDDQPLFAKIRSHISYCGAPIDIVKYREDHDKLLEDYKNGVIKLEQTSTFTAFKVTAKRWFFYKAEENKISIRLQYITDSLCSNDPKKWNISHIAP